MTPEDEKILKLTVVNAVQDGVSKVTDPMWACIRKSETAIALTQQELRGSLRSQIAQGERIGDLEKDSTVLHARIGAHVWWILGIGGVAVGIATALIIAWVAGHP
jgi:hypothetical protein